MKKSIFIFLIVSLTSSAFAQVKKSQVLVYGDNESAWAAAVQSAKSGVNTLWVRKNKDIGTHFIGNKKIEIIGNDGIDGGLWAEFLGKTRGETSPNDSVSSVAKQDINAQIARNVLSGISDSLKNLHQLFNTEVKSIKKSRKSWQIQLSNNVNLKVNAVVDASENAVLIKLLTPNDLNKQNENAETLINLSRLYDNTLSRTSIMAFSLDHHPMVTPASLVLSTTAADNFFVIDQYPWLAKGKYDDINNLPLFIQSGQTIGATAAYCAFFKTSTNKIDIRTLQGELLAFHGQLIPFKDIAIEDPHFSSIQRIGATDILKGILNPESNSFNFNPNHSVSLKEIEPIMLKLYSRSQIWFNDNKDLQEIALSDLLALIKFIALKGEELDADVKKGWKLRFHFSRDFNPSDCVSRRQLAVLVDYYLKPFNVKVDHNGKFKY